MTSLRRQQLGIMCHLSILAVLQNVAYSYNSPCDEQGLACLQPCSSQCTDPPLLTYRTPCVNSQNYLCQFTELLVLIHKTPCVNSQKPPGQSTEPSLSVHRDPPPPPFPFVNAPRPPFHCPGPPFSLYRTPSISMHHAG